tara:strand:- start:1656 stop:2567 length:912 start_codon:yes stop_codon:yes gene_type:complete
MRNKILEIYNLILDYLIYKNLKKRFKNYSSTYPKIAGRMFDVISLKILLKGRFENDELLCLKNSVFEKIDSKSKSALDIGANIGNHSLFFADYFNKVFAFEPLTKNYELLELNIKLKNNISAYNLGGSNKDEINKIYTPLNFDSGHSKIPNDKTFMDTEKENFQSEEVKLKRLDDFVIKEKINNIKFIKIDVEGYEYKVLQGVEKLLKNEKPVVAFEQFPIDFIDQSSKSINFLKKNDYKYFYEPSFFKRRKSKNKFISALYKILFLFNFIFNKKNNYKLELISNFEIKDYPMIIASVKDLNA